MTDARLCRIERALVSVYDKSGLLPLARALAARGVEILSTGGTARALAEAGIAVTDVAAVTQVSRDARRPRQDAPSGDPWRDPGAARQSRAPRRAGIARHRRRSISWSVNLYPFAATVARGAALDDCIEKSISAVPP